MEKKKAAPSLWCSQQNSKQQQIFHRSLEPYKEVLMVLGIHEPLSENLFQLFASVGMVSRVWVAVRGVNISSANVVSIKAQEG
jgi:hypothetical protein